MWFKCLLICFFTSLISCEKSFTIVLDTTSSMEDELDVIKVNLPNTINTFNNTDITNYILVPFNDPDVGEPTVVLTQRELLSSLNTIKVSGGRECPENVLTGIEKSLQISNQQSNIFVFTDAYAKDVHKLGSIENLCRSTRSQVVIFLTGFCSPQSSLAVNEQVYYDVAKACSGAVVHFDPATLRQAFKYIKEVINVEWTDVIGYDTFTEYKELSFTVDSFTKTVLLLVSGDSPRLELSTPDNSDGIVEKILDTRHTQVFLLQQPSVGNHIATIQCRNKTSVVLYKRYELPLRFGFSPMLPRSMSETSRRPMPGRHNKILIDASQSNIKLEAIEIRVVNEQEKTILVFEETQSTGIYLTDAFIEPDKVFCIWVKGYDTTTNQEINGSSENFVPQKGTATDSTWTKPQSEMLDADPLIDFGKNATLACKVRGYPAPTVTWEDDNGLTLPSETVLLEIPSLYISYASVDNATVNSTIYCKSQNSVGEDSCSLNLYVNRPYIFDVIQKPSDQTIEYGSEGRLYCEISAYPAAETKWYHNGTEVTPSDDLQIDGETYSLWIKNMTVSNVGEYKCELTNEANSQIYSAFVSISGIEAPEVEVEKTNVTLKLGDWSYLECRIIKGKPAPVITWSFKPENGFEFASLPDGVAEDDGKLKIASAQSEHKGVYRCDATNIEGHHSADITVQLQYAPLILNDADSRTVTVKEEDDVVLPCEVDAAPAASVRWEMSQDDVIITLDARHSTDRRHSHRFKALWKDSGNYHCIAENNIGTAQKTIKVNVLVAPYIEAPKRKTVVARTGDNVVLTCNVLFGNPVPSTKWEFIAPDSQTKVLNRSNSSSLLHLNNVSYINEGSYLCIADNDVGTDNINIYVKIQ
ncbi:hypothetical protein PYW08_006431 [Mythimna loreyi]|uniref:Uncharacterized protein n=1 Tax=Mythimna loreyi TaxID=667449 RepID=A0ACC2QNN7_9NEOP|nr:hypothetical protein PYW08_006431 [Mythimna loreyi]